jgi:SepF-like predicted cell division protein (DUF552 family)
MVEGFYRFGERLMGRFKGTPEAEEAVQQGELPELQFEHGERPEPAMQIRTSVLEEFADTEAILSHFRKGNTIMLIKIRHLREKDMSELKRAISRLKTHCQTCGADMAGIDEDWLVMAPSSAKIVR